MMGYTEQDIENFEGVLMNIWASGICNDKQKAVVMELKSFLEGLVMEGRI